METIVMSLAKNSIALIDTTLREGNQAPGVKFSVENSLEIAKALARLEDETIEVGHPSASDIESERVKSVVNLGLRQPILTHARANIKDIKRAAETGVKWVGIFAGLNQRARVASLSGR